MVIKPLLLLVISIAIVSFACSARASQLSNLHAQIMLNSGASTIINNCTSMDVKYAIGSDAAAKRTFMYSAQIAQTNKALRLLKIVKSVQVEGRTASEEEWQFTVCKFQMLSMIFYNSNLFVCLL